MPDTIKPTDPNVIAIRQSMRSALRRRWWLDLRSMFLRAFGLRRF